jgi:glucose/arabinose dehydrogenase
MVLWMTVDFNRDLVRFTDGNLAISARLSLTETATDSSLLKQLLRIPLLPALLILLVQTAPAQNVAIEPAWPDVRIVDPVDLQHAGDGSGRVFVVSQNGQIHVLGSDESVNEAPVFLDISNRITTGSEMGLLGLAFHPDYAVNGYFFVYYTTAIDGPRRSVISRFRVNQENADLADPASELILLEFNQPLTNHNAGQLSFGPDDGYLYVASGDGGGTGDPGNNAQNLENLLGAILRIDIDNTDEGLNYSIPETNPFYGSSAPYRKEIYAWGLRNPWRISFDPVTGWLWAADVGQGEVEEINIIESGGNYGWRRMEGTRCYNPETNCDTGDLEYPIWEYTHAEGRRSVTGGYVYRGVSYPDLYGKYIFGDYISRQIWALEYDGENPPENTELISANFSIPSFGLDEAGELYILGYNTNRIYRLIGELAPVTLISPVNLAEVFPADYLRWSDLPGADSYEITIATDESLTNVVFTRSNVADNEFSLELDELVPYTNYFWSVKARNSLGTSESETGSFYMKSIVSIDFDPEIAQGVVLEQNYPNPFNSTTQIRFYLPEAMPVLLEIYSVNGQYITTLADGIRDAGEHVATFHAGALSTGIYISRLQAGDRVRARKMLLVK